MALLGALCFALGALGFTHRSLRAHVNQLLGVDYNTNQMSYDLARLRINGTHPTSREHQHLRPDPRRPTRRGLLHQSPRPVLRPLLAADHPPAPAELRQALTTIDAHVRGYIDHARLGKAA
jgi:hypothetical protein